MIKAIKNIYTETVWRISRKIFLKIRNDSPSMQLDIGEKNLLKHFLNNSKKEKKILFDVGANIGSWSKLALKYDNDISIFAFEAINQTYLNLEKNLNNHNADIQIFNKAISNQIGDFEIYNFGENEGTNSFFDNSISFNDKSVKPPKIEKILTTTIDIFCKENNIDSIDFLKCDTEGNDFNVIMGCKEMFKNNRIIALQFEYNWRWINSKSYLKNVFDYFNDTNYLIGKITSNEVQIINDWNPELEKFYESNYLIINKDHIANFKHNFYYFNNKNILQIV
jgi:FkbM family methyltransferase